MPGKVNPTQCEALLMCSAQVTGNDVAINVGGSRGDLQLNVYKPMLVYDFLQSCRLLADGCSSFRRHLVQGITPNRERIQRYVEESLMLVTSLTPHIGYKNAATIAQRALAQSTTLRQAAVDSGLLSEEEFDRYVRPEEMLGPRAG
jgi:fumarate hydratase class II